jgi:hypothetical protein
MRVRETKKGMGNEDARDTGCRNGHSPERPDASVSVFVIVTTRGVSFVGLGGPRPTRMLLLCFDVVSSQ